MDKPHNVGTRCVFLIGLVALSGCVQIYHPSYPEGWGNRPFIAENACVEVSGDFQNSGKSHSDENDAGTLVRFFWSSFNQIQWRESGLDSVDHLRIDQGEDVIKISAWDLRTKIAQIELKRQADLGVFDRSGYCCTNEGLIARGAGPAIHALAGFVGQELTIFKLSNGSLVVKNTDTGGGLAVIVPGFESISEWHRYDPYTLPATSAT
jgi:hypothetical protein